MWKRKNKKIAKYSQWDKNTFKKMRMQHENKSKPQIPKLVRINCNRKQFYHDNVAHWHSIT